MIFKSVDLLEEKAKRPNYGEETEYNVVCNEDDE
jgi:hypothetical protein